MKKYTIQFFKKIRNSFRIIFDKFQRTFLIKLIINSKNSIRKNKRSFIINFTRYFLLIPLLFLSIIGLFLSGNTLIDENQIKFQKEGELSEIQLVRSQLNDINQEYTQLWADLLDKDYEIYKSLNNGEINQTDAIRILIPLVHRADVLFAKFLMTSKFHRISQFIKYDIFDYITNLLIPKFHEGDAYQSTSYLITFNIIISKNDNTSSYLKRFSIYGEYDLTTFKSLTFLTEDNQSYYFMYENTWEIFYTYTNYGIFNIFVNFQLFDAVTERFYMSDLIEVQEKIVQLNVLLNFCNFSTIFLTFLIGIITIKHKNKSKKEKI